VTRREIEMAILDGMTLGCKELQNEELPLDNDDNIGVLFDLEPDSRISEAEREALQKAMELIAKLLTPRELEALMNAPQDKAGMMARKRAMDKIRGAGIDALVNASQD